MSRLLGLLFFLVLLLQSPGCRSSKQAKEPSSSSPFQRSRTGPDLAAPVKRVRTIQLYKGSSERRLPVFSLNSEKTLTLEFDLMKRQGRPLSIYFQHADRTWNRDLTDIQILESFQDDRLIEYTSSRGTKVKYVHYVYRFPNDDIRFRISGNYVLRVTERGRRDSVLFERAFFVAEEKGTLRTGTETVLVPGQHQPSIRPVAHYTPPAEIRGAPFSYSVCFVRNGRLSAARCEDQPQLVSQPKLKFELSRSQAFGPETVQYGLDLSTLQPTNQIARVDRTTTPIQAHLSPDYARFGEVSSDPDVNGQIVVRGALPGLMDPALSAEYVETTFAFVPSSKKPYGSEFVVAGSFSNLNPDRGTVMTWIEEQSRYEGTVLLKQGRYEYFYTTLDPAFKEEMKRYRPQQRENYRAFVYYQDPQWSTDRLLHVGSFTP